MAKELFTLVGMKYRETIDFVAGLPRGETLTLVREPTNSFDQFAVQVWARGRHVAYVKASHARVLAMRMDTQTRVGPDTSMVGTLAVDGSGWPQVEVEG